MQSVIIGPNQAEQRFDKFLHKYLPNAGTSFLYKMLRKKNITLNGKKAEGNEILKLHDEVKLFFSDETIEKFMGQQMSNVSTNAYIQAYEHIKGVQIAYEDEHVLILNKPAGILTQKAQDKDCSLNEWMIGYLLHSGAVKMEELHSFKPSVVNRLDRNTSGLVLCGKTLAGSQALSKLIHDRTVKKFYRTVSVGIIREGSRIQGYLLKNHKTNKVEILRKKSATIMQSDGEADYIETAYQPLQIGEFHAANQQPCKQQTGKQQNSKLTYLEVELITGKTHQIRAHLASVGHPLIGDYKYGNRSINDSFQKTYKLSNQLLHAYRLEFPALSGVLEALSNKIIIASLPKQFEHILKDHFAKVLED